jgi:hypothetical protein
LELVETRQLEAIQVLTQPLVVAEEGTAARVMAGRVLAALHLAAQVRQQAV